MDAARGLGRGRGAAGGAHGQFRGRAPDARRGPDVAAGPAAHRPRAARRLVRREPGADGGRPAREAPRRDAPPDGPPVRRRRPLASAPPRGAPGARAPGRRAARPGPRLRGRARHAAALRARLRRAARGVARAVGREDRDRVRPLLRDGPRQAVGPRGPRLPGAGVFLGPARGGREGGDRGGLRTRRERRVHPADRDHGATASPSVRSATATRSSSSISGRTAPGRSRGP